jgi:flagellar motor switch protein FliN/FliY
MRTGDVNDMFAENEPDGAVSEGDLPVTTEAPMSARNLDMILKIPVAVQVMLGSAKMPVADLMKLNRGAIVALDHRIGEPVDVVVNGRIVARGEMVMLDEDTSRFGVALTEIVGATTVDV